MKTLYYIAWLMLFLTTQAFGQLSAAIFYGEKVPVTELCMRNIVIVDPYSDFNPKDYCNSISQAFAYVSLGEVALNSPYIKKIHPEWIIGKNEAWNNNKVLDQTHPEWRQFFLDQLIEPLWNKGYRGFFLDTLDSYYLAVHDPKGQQEQVAGIISLIKEIKKRHPDAKIILNRGFVLLPEVHSDVYAVLIESLYHAWHQNKRKYEATPAQERAQLLTEINKIRAMNLPIIIVDYLPPEQKNKAPILAAQLEQQGFIPWIADSLLQEIYIKKFSAFTRKILVAFTDDTKLPTRFSSSLQFIGPILEYMGYIPEYLNLDQQPHLPEGNLQNQYAGIILWIDSNKERPYLYDWALKQIAHKIPLIFLNKFGIDNAPTQLAKLGLILGSTTSSDKSLVPTKVNSNYVGLEMPPPIFPYAFLALHANSSTVLLQMKDENQQTEDAVAITPWGGYALVPYVVQYMPNNKAKWVINPINFFHDALRLKDVPIPDTTTENGRRLMMVHIDGDGFSYPAKWVDGRFAAEELRDRILKRFPIPTSVSVITGEIAPNPAQPENSPRLIAAAKSIFALPWVEIASHSFSHPFFWQPQDKTLYAFGEAPLGIKTPNYTFNLTTEITGSVDFINKYLAPADKKCHLFFWSGLSEPSEQALALSYQDKLLNINGNGSFITDNFPSLTGIRPMGFELGGYYQVFAPINLDFYYIDGFSGPLYGYEKVIQTLQLTDKPRRFKPIDLYYHIYSASYPATLKTIIKVYDWALKQPVMNIFTSEYIKKVLDYYQLVIGQKDNFWIIHSNGNLRELRSLNSLGYPDLEHSTNVIGFKENTEDRYIHLGPGSLTLLAYQQEKPTQPYLVDANASVVSFERKEKQLSIHFQGYRPLEFTIANVQNCKLSSNFILKTQANSDKTVSYTSKETNDEIHFDCR
ncbi:MAG: endo alpha-1,4 polygalactosaminidase [Legionella sp.]|uniref:bifunctional glycoside hydrolase 114/ polysaccharide deacetylase family protein n=1 Tax=Legionella sp. TaxID=459 RepID=UPI0028495ECB|nr:endo alpha-1,4 polygalactosaminidase [Legionella sp.]